MIVDGNTYCKIASFGPVLPIEYQEVEYVEGTGTQWIRTQIQIKQNDVLTIIISDISGEGFIYGQNDQGTSGNPLFQRQVGQDAISSRNTFTLSTNNNKLIYTFTSVNNPFNGYFGLWCVTYVGNPLTNKKGSGKFYGVKVYRNNTYAYNLIPCYRKSDNEIGMYDTVNKVFYTNQGTGTFLKGNNVVHTIRYNVPTEERPYISGHVTDGSSTFTFAVNGNQSITVPVDSNGNWKWVADRTITNLSNAFVDNKQIDSVVVYGLNDIQAIKQICGYYVAGNTQTSSIRSFIFKNCDLSQCTNIQYAFSNCTNLEEFIYPDTLQPSVVAYGYLDRTKIDSIKPSLFKKLGNWNNILANNSYVKTLDVSLCENPVSMTTTTFRYIETIKIGELPETFNPGNGYASFKNLKNIEIVSTKVDLQIVSNSLTEQSVINLINAAAANVIYTLHSTVYNKCASGGDWYTDVQAAINAKALEGYTVTLISA